MAVWRILPLSRIEVQYLVGSMTYSVVWEQVYGLLRQLALPESRAFTADRRPHGHPWSALLPTRLHWPLVQMSTSPTLGHHAARGPTAALVAYRGGWYIEA